MHENDEIFFLDSFICMKNFSNSALDDQMNKKNKEKGKNEYLSSTASERMEKKINLLTHIMHAKHKEKYIHHI